jgi:hypothetical protein
LLYNTIIQQYANNPQKYANNPQKYINVGIIELIEKMSVIESALQIDKHIYKLKKIKNNTRSIL